MATRLAPLHIVKHTSSVHTGTVIFFHGSGDTSHNMKKWVDIVLRKEMSFPQIKVIFPNAPSRPYTPNGGNYSNVWFDRVGINPSAPEHFETLEDIGKTIKELIAEEGKFGILPNRILVGGFSMGGAAAYHTAYRWTTTVAGVFVISSFLNENSAVYKNLSSNNSKSWPELLHLHGDRDNTVPIKWGKDTFDKVTSYDVKGEFHLLPMIDHAISGKGMRIVQQWIEKKLPSL